MGRFRLSNDSQLKGAALIGAAALAISQSDRDILDPKLWALAIAAGAAAVVTLLRPPGMPSPNQQQQRPPMPDIPPATVRGQDRG